MVFERGPVPVPGMCTVVLNYHSFAEFQFAEAPIPLSDKYSSVTS